MRCLSGLLLILVCLGCESRTQQDVIILNGMSRDAFIKIAKDTGGEDITKGMELAGNGRELKEMYWHFKNYNMFIRTDLSEGTLKGLSYWKYEDFVRSKSDRAEKERAAKSLRLNTATKRFKAE